jgi:hypothetical protein
MALATINLEDAPCEVQCAIREFFPEEEWQNAVNVFWLESKLDPFAVADTRDPDHPCGSLLRTVGGVEVLAEYSIGIAQINACNFPDWPPERFFNVRHNIGTAHLIWTRQGWAAWWFSAKTLGLI